MCPSVSVPVWALDGSVVGLTETLLVSVTTPAELRRRDSRRRVSSVTSKPRPRPGGRPWSGCRTQGDPTGHVPRTTLSLAQDLDGAGHAVDGRAPPTLTPYRKKLDDLALLKFNLSGHADHRGHNLRDLVPGSRTGRTVPLRPDSRTPTGPTTNTDTPGPRVTPVRSWTPGTPVSPETKGGWLV